MRGGWDTTYAFTPMFGVSGVSMEADAVLAELRGDAHHAQPARGRSDVLERRRDATRKRLCVPTRGGQPPVRRLRLSAS